MRTIMVRPPPKLEENVEIAEWLRNRRGQIVRVTLRAYNDHPLLDIRTWWIGDDRAVHPGKGISVRIKDLPQLSKAVTEALKSAQELGLLDSEGA